MESKIKLKNNRLQKLMYISSAIFIAFCMVFLVNYFFRLKNNTIELIGEGQVSYGKSLINGKLVKDTEVGVDGNYLLLLANNKSILLDVQGFDAYVGKEVQVEGILSPASSYELPLNMSVNSISLR